MLPNIWQGETQRDCTNHSWSSLSKHLCTLPIMELQDLWEKATLLSP